MLQPKVYIKSLGIELEATTINFLDRKVEIYNEYNKFLEDGLSCFESYSFDEVEFIENTGFKDMNGNDIFVGDIIKHHNSCLRDRGKNFLVEKHDFDKRYTFSNLDEYYYDLDEEEAEFVEVIGNIYENKELVENE